MCMNNNAEERSIQGYNTIEIGYILSSKNISFMKASISKEKSTGESKFRWLFDPNRYYFWFWEIPIFTRVKLWFVRFNVSRIFFVKVRKINKFRGSRSIFIMFLAVKWSKRMNIRFFVSNKFNRHHSNIV